MKKFTLIIIPCILMFLVCAKAEKTDTHNTDNPQAPDFILEDLDGNKISLSDYSEKVIFLNFWATWCPPCREEIPGFIEAYDQYKDKGMVIIGISVDQTGSNSVRKFVKKHKINYPVAMFTSKLIRDYQPGFAIPVTIIIDKNGKLRQKHIAYMSKEILEDHFLKLIEEN